MYILDPQQQHRLIREMSMTRKDNETSEAYYYHSSTEKMWKSFFPKANDNARGPKILRLNPIPESPKQLFKNCLIEGDDEDARGLGIELSASPEKWEQLMDILENNYRRYNRKQLSIFLKNLHIEDYQSLFNQLNYSPEALNLTEETLENLARRSKKMRFKRFLFFWV